MSKFNHVMLDLETLSTRSDAAIIQVAAIAFDIETGELGPRFNAYVNETEPEFRGYVDTNTIAWWLQQRVASAMGVKLASKEAHSLIGMIHAFGEWFAYAQYVAGPDHVRVWGHGASFDVPILASAHARVGVREPWHYRSPRDTRTLYEAAGMGEGQRRAPDPDRKHDAEYDCEYQISQVVEAYATLRQQRELAESYARLEQEALFADPTPTRGNASETHDDPPVDGGYTGAHVDEQGGKHSNPEAAL